MTKNRLSDLNNHLFAQLERLDDEDLTSEELEKEIGRAKAITGIAEKVIDNASLTLNALKYKTEYNLDKSAVPEMLQLKESNNDDE